MGKKSIMFCRHKELTQNCLNFRVFEINFLGTDFCHDESSCYNLSSLLKISLVMVLYGFLTPATCMLSLRDTHSLTCLEFSKFEVWGLYFGLIVKDTKQ